MPRIRWLSVIVIVLLLKVTPFVLGAAHAAWAERSSQPVVAQDGWALGGATVVVLFLLGLGLRYVLKDRPLGAYDVLMALAFYVGTSASAALKASDPVAAGLWILAFAAAMGLGAWQPGAGSARRSARRS